MQILFTIQSLDSFTGSVFYVAEIAEYLLEQGHKVDCCCLFKNKQTEIYFEHKNIKTYTIETVNLNTNYDIVFSLHYPVFSTLLNNGIKAGKVVPFSLSPFLEVEMPPAYYKKLNKIVAVSNEIKDTLKEKYQISEEEINVYPNFVPQSYFSQEKRTFPKTPRNIIIISNHIPQELKQCFSVFQKNKINYSIYGKGYNYTPITPKLLAEADVIISIGKTVQYALAMGIPCYNYDHFGGSGYITPENIDTEEYYNFSGRSFKTQKDAQTIFVEIVKGYDKALAGAPLLKKLAQERYYLQDKIDEILANLKETPIDKKEISVLLKKDILAGKKILQDIKNRELHLKKLSKMAFFIYFKYFAYKILAVLLKIKNPKIQKSYNKYKQFFIEIKLAK